MTFVRHPHVVLVLLALIGCSDPSLVPLSFAPNTGATEDVFVATSRAKGGSGWFTDRRAAGMNYLSVPVNFPASYRPGDRAEITSAPDPETDFSVSSKTDMTRSGFASTLRRHLKSMPRGERDLTLYVHGFYNNFISGVFRSAQLKRDFGLSGAIVHFAWPSRGSTIGYVYDRESVLFSRDGLEDTLRLLASTGAERITIIGHSLGAMLVMETLRQIEISSPGWVHRNIDGLAFVAPDVDLDVFKSQAARLQKLPENTVIFMSSRDQILMLSSGLTGTQSRLGNTQSIEVPTEGELTIVDVSALNDSAGSGHFIPATSPAAIEFIRRSPAFVDLFPKANVGTMIGSNVRLFQFVMLPR